MPAVEDRHLFAIGDGEPSTATERLHWRRGGFTDQWFSSQIRELTLGFLVVSLEDVAQRKRSVSYF